MADPFKETTQARRLSWALTAGIGYAMLGYGPTLAVGDFRVTMVLAGAGMIIVGLRSKSVRTGAIRGAILGILAGAAAVLGLGHYQLRHDSIVPDSLALLILLSITTECIGVGVFCAHLAQKRREQADQQWRQ